MTGLHIAIDMDDVIVDFVPTVLEAIRRDIGPNIALEDVTTWDMDAGALADVDFPGGGTWMEWLERWPSIWRYAPPMLGALEGLATLRAAGHTLEILTKKPAWAEYVVWGFLHDHSPPVQRATIVPSGARKERCSDADILIDDSPENVLCWADTCRSALLFDRPWNRDILAASHRNLLRVEGWAGVLRVLDRWPS